MLKYPLRQIGKVKHFLTVLGGIQFSSTIVVFVQCSDKKNVVCSLLGQYLPDYLWTHCFISQLHVLPLYFLYIHVCTYLSSLLHLICSFVSFRQDHYNDISVCYKCHPPGLMIFLKQFFLKVKFVISVY